MRGLAKAIRIGLGTAMIMSLASVTLVPTAAAAKDLSARLPRQPLLPAVMAVSGSHLLVRADITYRLSHDSGKTWTVANLPCPDSDPRECFSDGRLGRVSNGIVTSYSSQLNRVDAYSLTTNASVGTPYTFAPGESIVDQLGPLVLTQTWPSNTAQIHSLLDGSHRDVALPALSIAALLPDGSVVYSSGASEQWYRLRPDGSSTLVLSVSPSASDRMFTGNLMAYTSAKKLCVLNLDTGATSCRTLPAKPFGPQAFNAAGVLISTTKTSYLWYPLKAGTLRAPVSYHTLVRSKGERDEQRSGESGAVVTTKSTTLTKLYLFRADGKMTTRTLSWATRPVVPRTLALTGNALLGGTDSRDSAKAWVRTVTKTTLSGAKKFPTMAQVGASGSRWATTGGKLRIYDQGRLKVTRNASESDQLAFSGPYLLARPLCRAAPLQTDDDCWVPSVLLSAAGKHITTSPVTEDIFGELRVVRTGDGTVKSRTAQITNFVHPAAAPIEITLPDLGSEGYYTDVRLWGDTVAATAWPSASAQPYPIVINYRLGQTFTGDLGQQLKALGDGYVVSVAWNGTTIHVWDFVHNTTSALAASAGPVAVAGARLAYVASGTLRVTSLSGVSTSAPRILGAVIRKTSSRTWVMDVDLTKATKAGRVEIRNQAGTLVRSLTVRSSVTGSLRKLTWNGRAANGKKVPAGLYTARLLVNAADGTGTVTDVYGAGTALAEFRIG